MRIRRFNQQGIASFRAQLAQLRDGTAADPDFRLLSDEAMTEAMSPSVSVQEAYFETKRQAAGLLGTLLKPLESDRLFVDAGLWGWLALLYFDSICPKRGGRRRVLADPHYILDPDFRRRYRHLLAAPVRVLWTIPLFNALFLDRPVYQHGEVMEQLMSRLYVMRIPAVAEAAERLYFDRELNRAKVGIFPTKPQRGDLRNRFPARLEQLDLTYDVHALNAGELIGLLGDEFNRWRAQ